METDTVDRIEHMTHGFAVVLVTLTGIQTLCGDVEAQLGPFGTFAVLACVGLSWHARVLRGCLVNRPRTFAAVASACAAVMTAAFLMA